MTKLASKRKGEKQRLTRKWESYTGTGITATKGEDALALRQSINGKEFAVVKLYGGCWSTSPIEIIEEIKSPDLTEARRIFFLQVNKLGYKVAKLRGPELLFS